LRGDWSRIRKANVRAASEFRACKCHKSVPSRVIASALAYARAMAPLKQKGDLAELMVAADLRRRGYRICIPFGEDCDYDLVVERHGRLERVQVKYACSDGATLFVRCYSHSLTNGRVRATKCYTAEIVDWIAVWDATTSTPYCGFAKRATSSGSELWSQPGSNRRPFGCKPNALPTELWPQAAQSSHAAWPTTGVQPGALR
jgi:hypothetical protein